MNDTDFSDKAMGRSRYVFDRELGCLVEITEGSNHPGPEKMTAPRGCIRDIEPYRAAASDVASENKRPIIGSRSRHREFLRDNNYVEVGNSFVPNQRTEMSRSDRIADIKRSLGE